MTKSIKGSKKWIRKLVNDNPELLNRKIKLFLGKSTNEINWVSPIKSENYKEYYSKNFLKKLDLEYLNSKLVDFWPSPGPHWDALGRYKQQVILIEAKSHPSELNSYCRAVPESLEKIEKSLEKTKSIMGCEKKTEWTKKYYQYANRLAHLYWFRENCVPAYLVNLCFLGDTEMNGPNDESEWKNKFKQVYSYLGLEESNIENSYDLYIDVKEI